MRGGTAATAQRALVADYNGTLASFWGRLDARTVADLQALRARGWKVLVASGMSLNQLREQMGDVRLEDLVDGVVAERGAVVWTPELGHPELLGTIPMSLIEALRAAGCGPLEVNSATVRMRSEQEATARDMVEKLGVAVDVLPGRVVTLVPRGIDKGHGVRRLLQILGIEARDAVAVGDAHNDLAMFAVTGRSFTVGGAPADVRAAATDHVGPRGPAGARRIIARLLGELDEHELS
jgi:hydroxymethylpyrimidine pyrophosphatase-like HAD family hydrolase